MKRIASLILCLMLLAGCTGGQNHRPQTTTAPTEPAWTLPPNPYGPEDFAGEKESLECLSGPFLRGIDVSHWQGDVDWQQVKAAGIDFVLIRLGQRGAEEGLLTTDSKAQEYYEAAKTAGLQIGAYFFSQAITPQEALEEAEYALQIIEGWELDLPLGYDWEHYAENGRTTVMDGPLLTACTLAFCQRVEQAGYRAMVYFNKEQSRWLDWQQVGEYALWMAMYDQPMTWPDRLDMWQYTCTGEIPGISTVVDMNLYFHYE